MTTTRITMRLLAGLTLYAGFGLSAHAQVPALTVEKALAAKPRQPNVNVGTPSPAQAATCRIDPIPGGPGGGPMGYQVRDGQGRLLRQFVSFDNRNFNIVSYYLEGQECYRETDSNKDGVPDMYRWLGANGSKWGIDANQDGLIDSWAVMSPEEASQELLAAVAAKDARRLEALLPTKADLEKLRLPPAEVARIGGKAAGAAARLAKAADDAKLTTNARWMHLELGVPNVTPADAFGGTDDLVTHKTGSILLEDGGQTHFVQTGEMVLVGRAWKVVEGPTAGAGAQQNPGAVPIHEDIKDELTAIDRLDKGLQVNPAPTPAFLAEYNGKRAEALKKIVAKHPAEETWTRQLVDSLTAAAEGPGADGKALADLKEVAKAANPKSPVAAYAAFRVMATENSLALAAPGANMAAVQDKCRATLEEFVKAYPAAEDAPEAMLRLAMAFEFLGKEGEAKAKTWYETLVKTFPQDARTAKAVGAVRRLDADGKAFELAGPTLAGAPFAYSPAGGKATVVYYWASWSSNLAEDAKRLKELAAAYAPKGVEVVTVNLDGDKAAAAQAAAGLPGTALYQPGGLDGSPLAAQYGIMVVPHVIVVGKDGKVANRNGQVGTLEDDLKKVSQ